MKDQIQIFENKEFGKVRVIEIDCEPWFIGKDVTAVLGYGNSSRDINRHVDAEDRQIYRNGTFEFSNRGITIINESGLYSLIMSSTLPAAKKFKRWVTSEVLPSIRKHGAYLFDTVLEEAVKSQDFAIELFGKLQAEKGKTAVLQDKLHTLLPKAVYYDLILQSKNAIPASLIAKDYGMTVVAFNALLHDLRIQYKCGGAWLLYQPYANKGYTKTRTYFINETTSAIHTYWTQAGRLFMYERLKTYGIVPLTEAGRMPEN